MEFWYSIVSNFISIPFKIKFDWNVWINLWVCGEDELTELVPGGQQG